MLFDTKFPPTVTPFERKFLRAISEGGAELDAEEEEKFQDYIERMKGEQLEEGEKNPVVFEPTKLLTFEFQTTMVSRISFTTADDPFYKSEKEKCWPECVVYNAQGEIIDTVSPH